MFIRICTKWSFKDIFQQKFVRRCILSFNSCIAFHLKIACTAEVSTKAEGIVFFFLIHTIEIA